MGRFKDELMQALQNVSGKTAVSAAEKTTAEALREFNLLYTCIVTFTLTTTGATVVVKQNDVVIAPEADGTYALKEGTYKYDVTKAGYTGKLNQTLTLTNTDETTGTKAVEVAALTTCVVTFTLTPEAAELVVKNGTTVLVAEADGKYLLPAGTYSYSASADTYTAVEDVELVINAQDETTGTKTVAITLELA